MKVSSKVTFVNFEKLLDTRFLKKKSLEVTLPLEILKKEQFVSLSDFDFLSKLY